MLVSLVKTNKGQSIIEAIAALAIAVVIISAISVAVITAVNNSDFGKNQNLATQYSQQGIEVLRQMSRSSWTTLNANPTGAYCLDQNTTQLKAVSGSCSAPNVKDMNGNMFFIRQVNLTNPGTADCNGNLYAKVSVLWKDGKCAGSTYCHSVVLESCYTNIESKTAP